MIEIKEINSVSDTGKNMRMLVDTYYTDLCEYGYNQLRLEDFFNFVKNLPYKKDAEPIEIIARPKHILTLQSFDCKKKAILIASFLKCNSYDYDFIGVSSRPTGEIHHVIVRAYINGETIDIDATYPQNELIDYRWTNEMYLSGDASGTDKPILLILSGNDDTESFKKLSHHIYMGEAGGIIAAIVAGVAAVTSAVIGAVSARRRAREAQEYRIELEQQRQLLQEQQAQKIAELLVYYGIPAVGILGVTIYFLRK